MKRMKMLGLCIVAVLGMSAVVASLAQANEPVFFGKAEVGKTVGNVKTLESSGVSFLEGSKSKLKIECKTSTGLSGEVNSATTSINNVTNFKECEVAGLALPCDNGGKTKEINTEPLFGELGAVTATSPGLRLKPEAPATFLAQFECAGGGVLIKAKGSVIGTLSGATANTVEAGKLATSSNLTLAQSGGIQKVTHFLTGPSQQITSVVSEFNTTTKEFETHEELSGQNQIAKLTTNPAGQLGLTK